MNDPKLMILGMGMVGRSLLHILLENRMFSLDDILVTDKSRKAFNYFRDLGGRKENFIHSEVDSKCYREVLDRLESGDYLISLIALCLQGSVRKEAYISFVPLMILFTIRDSENRFDTGHIIINTRN